MNTPTEIKKKRFPGLSAYSESDSDIFFGRENDIRKLNGETDQNPFTVLFSESGAGKTSLLNAGLIPFLKRNRNFEIFFIPIPKYDSESPKILSDFTYEIIENQCFSESYIDKLTSVKLFWNNFKKIKSERENPSVFLIFDSFENIFEYSENEQKDFIENLSVSVNQTIPDNIKNEIDKKLSETPDFLTDDGKKFLETKPDIRILFSINELEFQSFKTYFPFFPGIENCTHRLQMFSWKQVAETLAFPAKFSMKLNGQSIFASREFEFSEETLILIINFLTKNATENVRPVFVQAIGIYIENCLIKNETFELKTELDLVKILLLLYDKILDEIKNEQQNVNIKYFIEEALILENEKKKLSVYKGVAQIQYMLENSVITILKKNRLLAEKLQNRNDIFIELADDLWILPIIESKNRRKRAEQLAFEKMKQALEIKAKAEQQLLKSRKIRMIAFAGFAAFAIAVIGIIVINKARRNAEISEIIAKSNLFAYNSFKETENDPTIGFRLAEEAYRMNPTNPTAAGSLITAYYSTEAFYSLTGKIPVTAVSAKFSPDSKLILTNNTIPRQKFYFLSITDLSGKEILKISHESPIISSDFSPDGKIITLTDAAGFVCFYNLAGKEFRRFKAANHVVWLCRFSPNMDKFLTSDGEGKVKLWKADNQLITEMPKHDFDVYSVDFSPNGKFIVTADEFTVNLYDSNGKFLREIPVPNKNSYYFPLIQMVKFSHNSEKIVVTINDRSGKNHIAWLTDLTGFEQMVFRGHSDWLNSVEFSDDDTKIITTSRDKTIKIWNLNGDLIGTLTGHSSNILDAEFGENSNTVLTIGDDKTVRTWHLGRLLNPLAEINSSEQAIFSPDGLKILTYAKNESSLWDLTGKLNLKITENEKISAAAFSLSGHLICTGNINGLVTVFDISGKEICVLKAHKKRINSIAFSADSAYLLTSSDDSLAILWNISKSIPEKIFRTEGKCVGSLFSPDYKTIITADNNGNIVINHLNVKKEIRFKTEEIGISSVRCNNNCSIILVCGEDGIVRFFDFKGNRIENSPDLKNNITCSIFSPDGKYLLTGGDDGTLRLYNSKGKEMIKLQNPGRIENIAFSADSKYILSSFEKNGFKTSKIWIIDPEKILELTDTVKIFGNFQKISKEKLQTYID
jgi:WD40 repeat protein